MKGVAEKELRGGIPSRGKQYAKGCVVSMLKELKKGWYVSASSIVCQYTRNSYTRNSFSFKNMINSDLTSQGFFPQIRNSKVNNCSGCWFRGFAISSLYLTMTIMWQPRLSLTCARQEESGRGPLAHLSPYQESRSFSGSPQELSLQYHSTELCHRVTWPKKVK